MGANVNEHRSLNVLHNFSLLEEDVLLSFFFFFSTLDFHSHGMLNMWWLFFIYLLLPIEVDSQLQPLLVVARLLSSFRVSERSLAMDKVSDVASAFVQQMTAICFAISVIAISLSDGVAAESSQKHIPVTSKFQTIKFYDGYSNLWGSGHQEVSQDQSSTTIWLDKTSGSGFKSLQAYDSGFFSAAIKLQAGYTAGVIAAFYLSNSQEYPGHHDEIDMEFLGTTPDKPYTLQTNIYINGSGDSQVLTGRELKFHLWFDPTQDFHTYSILWTQTHIIFYVDDIAIRKYPKRVPSTFPQRPLWVYGSIWDASDWATENGKYRADYRYQPFVGKFSNFKLSGCPATYSSCDSEYSSSLVSSGTGGLTSQERGTMKWIQSNYLVYNYCKDHERYPHRLPECGKHYAGSFQAMESTNGKPH